MSRVFLDRHGGGLRLYLNGELQFDSRDERRYHEPLALVPVALARRRAPGRALRVLILGGGDGLALREVLRVPGVREVHLVDRDPEVVRLGRTELAGLNAGAFRDPRVRVHLRDARDYLPRARDFDAAIVDLTYPADVDGTALFTVDAFRRLRAAVRGSGAVGLNAVSPDDTPEAFGCIGSTLAEAGLAPLPLAIDLPSFAEEGYGRWGFFFASPRPIGLDEVRRLRFPADAALTATAVLDGLRFPAAARRAMRAAPNRTTELLYHLYNAHPLSWTPPFRPLRLAAAPRRPGPRLTAAEGFARWLRAPAGRRSVEELLASLPLSWRGQTREALREWSDQAEVLFREVDLRAFVERALRRAGELPAAWARELRALRARLADGLPPLGELLHQAYRVFAVYLLVLLLVNLFFPDNLYAKGWSSSSSSRLHGGSYGSDSDSGSGAFEGLHFSDPAAPGAFRFRPLLSRPGVVRVYDAQGRDYPALAVVTAAPGGAPRPTRSLLALTPDLQVLETGGISCGPPLAGYQCLLEPGRLRVLDAAGTEVVALLPPGSLERDVAARSAAQLPLVEQALADHRRWLEWTGWASGTALGREAASELTSLEGIRRALQAAGRTWTAGPPRPQPQFEPSPGWVTLVPGLYLEPPALATDPPTAIWVAPDGTRRRQSLDPPAVLEPADRFLFRALERRLLEGRDHSVAVTVARWRALHGAALGAPRAPLPPAPGS